MLPDLRLSDGPGHSRLSLDSPHANNQGSVGDLRPMPVIQTVAAALASSEPPSPALVSSVSVLRPAPPTAHVMLEAHTLGRAREELAECRGSEAAQSFFLGQLVEQESAAAQQNLERAEIAELELGSMSNDASVADSGKVARLEEELCVLRAELAAKEQIVQTFLGKPVEISEAISQAQALREELRQETQRANNALADARCACIQGPAILEPLLREQQAELEQQKRNHWHQAAIQAEEYRRVAAELQHDARSTVYDLHLEVHAMDDCIAKLEISAEEARNLDGRRRVLEQELFHEAESIDQAREYKSHAMQLESRLSAEQAQNITLRAEMHTLRSRSESLTEAASHKVPKGSRPTSQNTTDRPHADIDQPSTPQRAGSDKSRDTTPSGKASGASRRLTGRDAMLMGATAAGDSLGSAVRLGSPLTLGMQRKSCTSAACTSSRQSSASVETDSRPLLSEVVRIATAALRVLDPIGEDGSVEAPRVTVESQDAMVSRDEAARILAAATQGASCGLHPGEVSLMDSASPTHVRGRLAPASITQLGISSDSQPSSRSLSSPQKVQIRQVPSRACSMPVGHATHATEPTSIAAPISHDARLPMVTEHPRPAHAAVGITCSRPMSALANQHMAPKTKTVPRDKAVWR